MSMCDSQRKVTANKLNDPRELCEVMLNALQSNLEELYLV
jgi:hypothetical protein